MSFPNLQFPLRFGGFAAQALEPYLPLFRQMGFEPMMGGALSGGESSTPVKAELEPGSMISLLLVRGDLDLNADCTVTYRQGNNLYACGHRVLSVGPAQFPFAPAHVLVTVAEPRLVLQAGCARGKSWGRFARTALTPSTAWWEKRTPP